jgi:2-amino-4-hydroxy-6-hydroxymethyldihydropteridine diphosphokinase
VYLSIGGNEGDRFSSMQQALLVISHIPGIKNFKTSSLYETSPVSDIPQNDYLNAVCCFDTDLDARALLNCLQTIEKSLGKVAKPKNAARIIDIDMIFFGEEVFRSDELEIPHPRWRERLFVIIPLLELTPIINLRHPSIETIDLIKLRDSLIKETSQRVVRTLKHI